MEQDASTVQAQEIRPFGIGEILDAAFKIYRTHFRTLALCVLVVAVPLTIISVLVQASGSGNAFDPTPTVEQAQDRFSASGLASYFVGALIGGLGTLLATAACTRAVAAAYLGDRATWRESLRYAGRKLLPLILLSILVFAASALGVVLLFVGSVFVWIRLVVSTPAMLVEDLGPARAFRRSWSLIAGRWWATLATMVIVLILTGVLGGILQFLLTLPIRSGESSELLGAVLTGLGQILTNVVTLPLTAGVVTLIYFDQRVRKEGLDLELLARRIGQPATAPHPSGLGGDGAPATFGAFSPPSSDPPGP